ncbi:MAG: mammalian cell entry protein, partial [Mycobacterium sp.]
PLDQGPFGARTVPVGPSPGTAPAPVPVPPVHPGAPPAPGPGQQLSPNTVAPLPGNPPFVIPSTTSDSTGG